MFFEAAGNPVPGSPLSPRSRIAGGCFRLPCGGGLINLYCTAENPGFLGDAALKPNLHCLSWIRQTQHCFILRSPWKVSALHVPLICLCLFFPSNIVQTFGLPFPPHLFFGCTPFVSQLTWAWALLNCSLQCGKKNSFSFFHLNPAL